MRCLCCYIQFLSIKICISNENAVLSKPFLWIQNCFKVPDLLTASAVHRIFYYNFVQRKMYSNLSSRQDFNIQRKSEWGGARDGMEAVALVLHFLAWRWYSRCPGAVFHMLRWYSTGCAGCAACLCVPWGIAQFGSSERRHRAMILTT